MPRGNGTGPMGMGPMTGRGAGFCAGFATPGYANPGVGFRCGRGGMGMGMGSRGYRNMFRMTGLPGWTRAAGAWDGAAVPSMPSEGEALRRQAEFLESQLASIKERLDSLDSENK